MLCVYPKSFLLIIMLIEVKIMDIRCRKTDCKHNDRLTCLVDNLCISKGIYCNSYEKVPNKAKDFSKHMLTSDEPPEFCDFRHNKKCSICCSATCLFNDQCSCSANGITVGDIHDRPKCITQIMP